MSLDTESEGAESVTPNPRVWKGKGREVLPATGEASVKPEVATHVDQPVPPPVAQRKTAPIVPDAREVIGKRGRDEDEEDLADVEEPEAKRMRLQNEEVVDEEGSDSEPEEHAEEEVENADEVDVEPEGGLPALAVAMGQWTDEQKLVHYQLINRTLALQEKRAYVKKAIADLTREQEEREKAAKARLNNLRRVLAAARKVVQQARKEEMAATIDKLEKDILAMFDRYDPGAEDEASLEPSGSGSRASESGTPQEKAE